MLKNLCYIILALLWFQSCRQSADQVKTDWRKRYSASSHAPYGFSLMGASMRHLFKGAECKNVTVGSKIFMEDYPYAKAAYVLLAGSVDFSMRELDYFSRWIGRGNDVVIVSERFGERLLGYLNLTDSRYWHMVHDGSVADDMDQSKDTSDYYQQFELFQVDGGQRTFTIGAYRQKLVSAYFEINSGTASADSFALLYRPISTFETNKYNALMFRIGAGRLILMSTPLVLSNYSLLQGGNKAYLEQLMSYVSPDVASVYFAVGQERVADHSVWSILWQYKSIRWAMILALVGGLAYVLFNLQRRQNVIPVVKPLSNDSLSFVETIANLYYTRHDNRNLALKMIQHFLEQLRSQYKMDTSVLDNNFKARLIRRLGASEADVAALLYDIKCVQEDTVIVDDKFLYRLYKNIQKINKLGK